MMLEHANRPEESKHGQAARATKRVLALFALIACIVIGSLVLAATISPRPPAPAENGNPPEMVARLNFFDPPAAWAGGESQRVEVIAQTPARLSLSDSRNQFPRTGSWTS